MEKRIKNIKEKPILELIECFKNVFKITEDTIVKISKVKRTSFYEVSFK